MKFILAMAVMLFSIPSLSLEVGTSMAEVQLEDQFGETVKINPEAKHLIFVSEKEMSKIMTEHLSESKFNLAAAQVLYVSDISKMPSLITKMVALPKMRKYTFKVALDKSGDITKTWPRQDAKIAVIDLENQKVTKIQYVGSKEEISTLLKSY